MSKDAWARILSDDTLTTARSRLSLSDLRAIIAHAYAAAKDAVLEAPFEGANDSERNLSAKTLMNAVAAISNIEKGDAITHAARASQALGANHEQ